MLPDAAADPRAAIEPGLNQPKSGCCGSRAYVDLRLDSLNHVGAAST